MKTNPNDAAFARPRSLDTKEQTGLTKLEYFSAIALQGMIGKKYGHVDGYDAQECAELAVIYAKALIEELNKQEEIK